MLGRVRRRASRPTPRAARAGPEPDILPATDTPTTASSPAFTIGRGRRRFLGGSLCAGAAGLVHALSAPRLAFAHHGFSGLYDFAQPYYLAGRLVRAYVGFPHARLTLRVPENLRMPRDREWMRALEDAEARPTLTLLSASERRGLVEVTLGGRLTRRLVDEPELLGVDDPVQVVVYRRITQDEYRDELQAVLLALPDGRILVSSMPMQ